MGIFITVIIIVLLLFFLSAISKQPIETQKPKPIDEQTKRRNEIIKFMQEYEAEEKNKPRNVDLSFVNSNSNEPKYLIYDIETTGLPIDRTAKPEETENFPYIVQIAWFVFDEFGFKIYSEDCYIKQQYPIPEEATEIHHITNEITEEKGEDIKEVLQRFAEAIKKVEYIVAHNIEFSKPIIEAESIRNKLKKPFGRTKKICTMKKSASFCKIYHYGPGYKYPTLDELFKECFYSYYDTIHIKERNNAFYDAAIIANCFFHLIDEDIIKIN